MSKKLEITSKHLVNIKPVTDNQKVVFESWKTGQSQFLYGAAGTGKTFVSLYLALQEVLDTTAKWDKVIIVSAIDNLIKGAAGQAVQCFNIAENINETLSLL